MLNLVATFNALERSALNVLFFKGIEKHFIYVIIAVA
jgi:hypothetical protein